MLDFKRSRLNECLMQFPRFSAQSVTKLYTSQELEFDVLITFFIIILILVVYLSCQRPKVCQSDCPTGAHVSDIKT